jgi:hypothetical protein
VSFLDDPFFLVALLVLSSAVALAGASMAESSFPGANGKPFRARRLRGRRQRSGRDAALPGRIKYAFLRTIKKGRVIAQSRRPGPR